MHTIKIPTKYPRPKYSIGDLVIYNITSKNPKIGEIIGLSWNPHGEQWEYAMQELRSTDTDEWEIPNEDEILPIVALLKNWQPVRSLKDRVQVIS